MKILKWLKKLVLPRQSNEDLRRQELIINIILVFSLISFFILNIIRITDYLIYTDKRGLPLWISLFIFIFFFILLKLSHHAWLKTVSVFLISIFALPMFYSFYFWGADLPAALLLSVLVILLSGILLGARFAFINTFLIAIVLIYLTNQQASGLINVQDYWRTEPAQIADVISYVVLLSIISLISWLFCRELNRSLKRAQKSESLLKEERDFLEIKVEARTKELRELEAEKINQLYRFAEFGRLSSGIFHDLINPLSAVSLNLEQIKTETDTKILSAKSYLSQALLATSKMESLISSIKKQLSRESIITQFSLNQEINQIIQILSYKARRAQVKIEFLGLREVELTGDALKFGQIISNLIANAIEACEKSQNRNICLNLDERETDIKITISDSGEGIEAINLEKIFLPFFSTKKTTGQGLGLGLSSTKNIVEKDFGGRINVMSTIGEGTIFKIIIPKQNA